MKKSITRRTVLKNSIKASLAVPFLSTNLLGCTSNEKDSSDTNNESKAKLKILILGGTSFLGPHQIAYALSRGHSVSTFTRGKTQPTIYQDLFKEVESLVGDRENDLTALENGTWDVVIDNSGRKVQWTKDTAELLKDKVELYLYTSSTGVYYPYLGENIDETTELLLEEPEEVTEEEKLEYWYGVMKANSEIAAIKAFGEDRSIIVRPTYMIGPADQLDRFIHWPVRLPKGGEIMVPGRADDPVQYADVRDVAEFMIRLAEEKKAGTYNAAGPIETQTMHDFAKEAQKTFDVTSTLVYIDDYDFLKENKVHYLVPWIPSEGNNYGSARVNNQRAIEAGLTFRSLQTSIKDTHDWWYSDALTDERREKYELNPDTVLSREKVIIEKWKEQQAG